MYLNLFLFIYFVIIFKVNCCYRTNEQFEDESRQYKLSRKIDMCQEICLEQHSVKNVIACRLKPLCSKCWNGCKFYTKNKITAPFPWPLRIATMVKQEFLVATHVAWEPNDILINCLVTWEVYGGGLMGNLMADTNNVELSLWPDTKYRVHVTCNDKKTGREVLSPPIFIDTSNAIEMKPVDNNINDNTILLSSKSSSSSSSSSSLSSTSISKSSASSSSASSKSSTSDQLMELLKELNANDNYYQNEILDTKLMKHRQHYQQQHLRATVNETIWAIFSAICIFLFVLIIIILFNKRKHTLLMSNKKQTLLEIYPNKI